VLDEVGLPRSPDFRSYPKESLPMTLDEARRRILDHSTPYAQLVEAAAVIRGLEAVRVE